MNLSNSTEKKIYRQQKTFQKFNFSLKIKRKRWNRRGRKIGKIEKIGKKWNKKGSYPKIVRKSISDIRHSIRDLARYSARHSIQYGIHRSAFQPSSRQLIRLGTLRQLNFKMGINRHNPIYSSMPVKFRWGEIEYLNLLPVRYFLKKKGRYSQWIIRRGVPTQINRWLKRGIVDAGFISSIASSGYWCLPMGIVATGVVWSVLICPDGKNFQSPIVGDKASATSNRLARVLNQSGKVVIGDRALQLRFSPKGKECRDLAEIWWEKSGLPFPFALLCCRKKSKCLSLLPLVKLFFRQPIPIPNWEIGKWAEQLQLSPSQISAYLSLISYKIGWREQLGLKRFFQLAGIGVFPRLIPI